MPVGKHCHPSDQSFPARLVADPLLQSLSPAGEVLITGEDMRRRLTPADGVTHLSRHRQRMHVCTICSVCFSLYLHHFAYLVLLFSCPDSRPLDWSHLSAPRIELGIEVAIVRKPEGEKYMTTSHLHA